MHSDVLSSSRNKILEVNLSKLPIEITKKADIVRFFCYSMTMFLTIVPESVVILTAYADALRVETSIVS